MSERPRHQVYLGLGANLGSRQSTLAAALAAVGAFVTLQAISPLYESEPWGPVAQPKFLNLCAVGESALEPRPLLERIKRVERDLGRRPAVRWGPRHIDIDILLYDDLILNEPGLTLPHPRLTERAFVLRPLLDIAPELIHPASGRPLAEALAALPPGELERVADSFLPSQELS